MEYYLILGDCLSHLKYIPDMSIDFILTDPPYGTTKCKWDEIIPLDILWIELNRILKPKGAIALFGSEPFSSKVRLSNIKNFRYDWIWEKSNPANISAGKSMPMKYHEIISIFNKGNKENYYPQKIKRESERVSQAYAANYKFTPTFKDLNSSKNQAVIEHTRYDKDLKLPSSVLKFNSIRPNSKEKVDHPTQKPVALLEYLIKTYTKAGNIVLDFAMGSGSTGVACRNLNRAFIGIEKEEKYFNMAKERIEKT